MPTPLRQLILHLKLIWNHIIFWTIPTLQETYYTKLGHTYFELEEYKKAISKFEKSEKSHNYDKSYSTYNWYYLGHSYLNLGNYKNAVFYFNKYLTLKPRDNFARFTLGTCYVALNEPELALQSCRKALENGTGSIAAHVDFAIFLKEIGRKEEALEYLQKAEAKTNNPTQKAIIRSANNWVGGNLEEAINTIKNAILKMARDSAYSKSTMKADSYIMLSRFQKEIKDTPGSLATLETATALYPNDPILMNELALGYAELKINLDKAAGLITRALEYQPDNSFFLDTKGWVLYKMGKPAEAKKIIQESLQLNPKNEETLEHMKLIKNL